MRVVEDKDLSVRSAALPEPLRALFWDHDLAALDWQRDRDFVIGRVLESGTWDAIQWLRREVGDATIRDWILRREGRALTSQQLRFWELILDLPAEVVDRWLGTPERMIWEGREAK